MTKKFLRRTWNRYSKLGKRRKKKQVWRKPKGRDNKMREKRKGYPQIVSVGYQKNKKLKGRIECKQPVIIKNIKEIGKVKKDEIVILGNIGKKKKIEIAKKAKEKGIEIHNLDVKKFLKKNIKKENKEKSNEPKKPKTTRGDKK